MKPQHSTILSLLAMTLLASAGFALHAQEECPDCDVPPIPMLPPLPNLSNLVPMTPMAPVLPSMAQPIPNLGDLPASRTHASRHAQAEQSAPADTAKPVQKKLWTYVVTKPSHGDMKTWYVALPTITLIDASSREALVRFSDEVSSGFTYFIDAVDCKGHGSLLVGAAFHNNKLVLNHHITAATDTAGEYSQALELEICSSSAQPASHS